MRKLLCSCVLVLASCATSPELEFAPSTLPAGYPVFVMTRGSDCNYGVQDMIFIRDRDFSGWLDRLPEKSSQIDLVVATEIDSCAKRAAKLAAQAGFADVRLRHRGDASYPSGLPAD